MNFSVLRFFFFKFASRIPQIAQILVSTFKIFQGVGGGGGGGGVGGPGSVTGIIIIIINLIYIAQFDTNGILTALYIVITYIQMQYVHV